MARMAYGCTSFALKLASRSTTVSDPGLSTKIIGNMGDRDVPLFFAMAFKVDGTEVTGSPAGAAGQDDNPLADQNRYTTGRVAGSGYKNGTYDDVPLQGGSGQWAQPRSLLHQMQ